MITLLFSAVAADGLRRCRFRAVFIFISRRHFFHYELLPVSFQLVSLLFSAPPLFAKDLRLSSPLPRHLRRRWLFIFVRRCCFQRFSQMRGFAPKSAVFATAICVIDIATLIAAIFSERWLPQLTVTPMATPLAEGRQPHYAITDGHY